MKIQSIAWLQDAPNGTKLEAFQGIIVKIGQRKNGTSNYKDANGNFRDWSLQDLTLKDATGEMVLTLDGRDELDRSWLNAPVVFYAGEKEGKPTGLVCEDHENKRTGNVIRRVRAMWSAIMEEIPQADVPEEWYQRGGQRQPPHANQQRQQPAQQRGQGGQERQQPAQRQQEQPRPQQRPQEAQQTRQQPAQQRQQGTGQAQAGTDSQKAALKSLKVIVAKLIGVRKVCYDACVVRALETERVHGHKTDAGGIGAESSSLFIETMRRMDHATFDALPLDPYKIAPYQGEPLSKLYEVEKRPPFPTDKSPEEVKRMEAEAKAQAQPAPQERQQPAQQRQQPAQAQQPAPEPEFQDDGWGKDDGQPRTFQDNFEDDDIPF